MCGEGGRSQVMKGFKSGWEFRKEQNPTEFFLHVPGQDGGWWEEWDGGRQMDYKGRITSEMLKRHYFSEPLVGNNQ